MRATAIAKGVIVALAVWAAAAANAQSNNFNTGAVPNDLQLILASELPDQATWYSLSCPLPPCPFNYCAGRTDVSYYMSPSLGANTVFIDDPATAWAMATTAFASAMDQGGPPVPPPGGGSGTNNFPCGQPLRPPLGIGWSNLWLEIIIDSNNVGYADLILHGATNSGYYYQLLSDTNLINPSLGGWVPGEFKPSAVGTNDIWFTPVPCTNPPNKFFWAVGSSNVAFLPLPSWGQGWDWTVGPTAFRPDASGAGAINSWFTIGLSNTLTTNVTVYYAATGVPVYGLDYTNVPGCLTNAMVYGSVVIPAGSNYAQVTVCPMYRANAGFGEVVNFMLLSGSDCVVNPTNAASILIMDSTNSVAALSNMVSIVATNIPGIADLDYLGPSNCLVLSLNWWGGLPYNFALFDTNANLTYWSSVADLQYEVNIATVKATTNGFTNGYTYFIYEEAGAIGWVAPDGTTDDTDGYLGPFWSSVPTGYGGTGLGDLYFDQMGVWGNKLLAAGGSPYAGWGGLHSIDPEGNPTLIATLPTGYVEGLLTLPGGPQYGPWATMLLASNETNQTIYAISTNGVVQPWNIGVTGQKLLIIPPNENLYCMDANSYYGGWILKFSKGLFASHVGDILAIQCPEQPQATFRAALYTIHWNTNTRAFETSPLFLDNLPFVPAGEVERGAFAPFDMPPAQ